MNNSGFISCPRCGANNKSDAILCMRCGYNFHTNTDLDTSQQLYKENMVKKRDKTSTVCLICSVINIVLIFPFVFKVSALSLLFGTLSSKISKLYVILLLSSGYSLASVVAVPSFIVSFISKGKYQRGAVTTIVSSFIIGLITAILLLKFYK